MTARLYVLLVCAPLALLGGCGGAPDTERSANDTEQAAPPELGMEIGAEDRQKLGIELGEVSAATFEPSVAGTARVLDAQPVVMALAELVRTETQARTSATALRRAQELYRADTAVSAETFEAAERQAAADDAQLTIARANVALGFGAAAPWLDDKRRAPLVTALTSGSMLVVSASFPGGLPESKPAALDLKRVGSAAGALGWRTTELWLAPADPAVPGPALLALVSAETGLGPGERLTASVPAGAAETGTVVPASAVVLAGGQPWCYVQTDDDTLVRRPVDLGRPVADGYFQQTGFAAGEQVVVSGAGLLLARETAGAEPAD